jgi:putative colanic acid biosynthesis acetyltransferase WcaF
MTAGENRDILRGSLPGTAQRQRSFTRRHIAFRALWNATWWLLAAWTPPMCYAWRRFVLRLFGASMARTARVYGSARVWYPPNLHMGLGTVLGPHVQCYSMDRIVLDDYAEVAQFVHLVTGTHDTETALFQLRTRPIHIGSHAWLASGSFVGPGVTVGEGAVLGARGVAFSDLAPWTIHAGNPAQAIRPRHNFTAGAD